ncbi:MAG TPA: hypothetical protein P5228_05420 [Bacteroidales bacterium]|nr:hypothetical protein [Bacteroidales bacterium]HRZ47786.1 hypothetical protein [Bacteroidales bacterium]
MKKVTILFSLLLMAAAVALMFTQCAKEGPRGPAGADGIDGQDGTDGNANVITYFFTDSAKIAWNTNSIYFYYDANFSIPDSIMEYGVILVYTKVKNPTASMWYPVPGLGENANYVTRLFIRNDYLMIRGYNPDGSPWSGGALPELAAVKVILIPSTTILNMKKAGGLPDFRDYNTTVETLGLVG